VFDFDSHLLEPLRTIADTIAVSGTEYGVRYAHKYLYGGHPHTPECSLRSHDNESASGG